MKHIAGWMAVALMFFGVVLYAHNLDEPLPAPERDPKTWARENFPKADQLTLMQPMSACNAIVWTHMAFERGDLSSPVFYGDSGFTGKPVIYLYPEQEQDVNVKLAFDGTVSYTYPEYAEGWEVTAQPDGTLTNKADDSTHYYLFWDGIPNPRDWDFSTGFVVKGSEATVFLQDKLPKLGLTPKEYNDFIVYWAPLLGENEYNLVTFATTQYEELAQLDIDPAPDNILRVHMVYKAIDQPVEVQEQTLPTAAPRTGFTVVEWGGTRVN